MQNNFALYNFFFHLLKELWCYLANTIFLFLAGIIAAVGSGRQYDSGDRASLGFASVSRQDQILLLQYMFVQNPFWLTFDYLAIANPIVCFLKYCWINGWKLSDMVWLKFKSYTPRISSKIQLEQPDQIRAYNMVPFLVRYMYSLYNKTPLCLGV